LQTFIKVDVDDAEAIAQQEEISAMPTFKVYQEGVKVDELVGASDAKLKELVLKWA
jgi:thioredoxin-like negative regulator of GroEL